MSRSKLPSLASLALLLVFGTSCGQPDSALPAVESSRELLEREPDVLLETLATLLPTVPSGWMERNPEGWHDLGTDGRPSVQTNATRASLTLPAIGPRDRKLELDLQLVTGAPTAVVDVHLNGQLLEQLDVSAQPATYALDTPAAAWLLGENLLTLTQAEGSLRRGDDGLLHGLALTELRYGEPHRVQRTPTGFRLAAGTGLRYRIEERGAAELVVAAEATGAGQLAITSHFLTQTTTSPVADRDASEPFQVTTGPGALRTTWTLPPAEEALLEVELLWTSPSGADLELTGLTLREVADRRPPPIVLISIDTLAAGHTSLYGYARKTTPKLDAFASDATLFAHCATNAPWTMPSYAALMSGYYPSSARVSPNLTSTHFAFTLPDHRWTLAEALGAAGYRTGAFVDSPNVGSKMGFAQGFDVFDESSLELPHGDPAGGLRMAADAALAWLDAGPREQPYFLFLHANDVHGPYQPKAEQRGAFRADTLAEPGRELLAGALTGTFREVPKYVLESALEEYDATAERLPAAPFVAAYDESILSMDALLGEFLEELEARGVLDEAIVIFTADHGEAFDEHDLYGHGQLYQEVLHVPLVLSLPPSLRTPATPARVELPVQLVDLYPTLIEWAGLSAERTDLHGRSLAPLLLGESLPAAPTFAEGGVMRQSSIVLDGWKLLEKRPGENSVPWTMLSNPNLNAEWRARHAPEVTTRVMDEALLATIASRLDNLDDFLAELSAELGGPVYELFDLEADPRELKNLAAEHPEIVTRLMPHLLAAQARLEEMRAGETNSGFQLSEEDLAKLRALGY